MYVWATPISAPGDPYGKPMYGMPGIELGTTGTRQAPHPAPRCAASRSLGPNLWTVNLDFIQGREIQNIQNTETQLILLTLGCAPGGCLEGAAALRLGCP